MSLSKIVSEDIGKDKRVVNKAKMLNIITTETEGAVESFDYALDYNEDSYFKAIYITIKVQIPKNLKYNNMESLKIVLEGEVDTKETEGMVTVSFRLLHIRKTLK